MQKPVSLLLLIGLFLVKNTWCQSNELMVLGETGKLHLLHTVTAKENWYSVGRLFNLSPKEIAPFNKLSIDQPLSIGEQLQIPLVASNFSQNNQAAAAGETLVPVYYIVQEKEWMYRISVNHNKVSPDNLEKWNNMGKGEVKAGMRLIIGYLRVKTAQSALAAFRQPHPAVSAPAGASGSPAAATAGGAKSGSAPAEKNGAGVTGGAAANGTAPGATAAAKPAVKSTDSTNKSSAAKGAAAPLYRAKPAEPAVGAVTGSKPAESKPAAQPATEKPAGVPASSGTVGSGSKATGAAAASGAGVSGSVAGTGATGTAPGPGVAAGPGAAGSGSAHFNGGYFRADFNESYQSASGVAGTFKSTSGWQDGKYYALMNNVAVGTIIRITLPGSTKSVYAKVLGQLPDMKESAGLTARISNAAASELGQAEGKFNVDIKY